MELAPQSRQRANHRHGPWAGYDNEQDARSMADRIIGGEFKNAEKKISR